MLLDCRYLQTLQALPQTLVAHFSAVLMLLLLPQSTFFIMSCRFIRDRLHERCPFFRLWPSQLQQLICRLARPMHWVQHEVLASQGGASCKDLCFILEGKVGTAVGSVYSQCHTWRLMTCTAALHMQLFARQQPNSMAVVRHTPDLALVPALQAAVAVRSAPGSSTLKDVAVLKDGDTFGELALLVSHAARAWYV